MSCPVQQHWTSPPQRPTQRTLPHASPIFRPPSTHVLCTYLTVTSPLLPANSTLVYLSRTHLASAPPTYPASYSVRLTSFRPFVRNYVLQIAKNRTTAISQYSETRLTQCVDFFTVLLLTLLVIKTEVHDQEAFMEAQKCFHRHMSPRAAM